MVYNKDMKNKKRCCECKKNKFLKDFHNNKSTKDGLATSCKVCAIERTRKYKIENPERSKMNIRNWYNKNKKKVIDGVNKYNQSRDEGLFYKYWSMKRRCEYPSQRAYKWYGAKGIIVEWTSYIEFKKDMYRTYKNHLAKYGHKQTTLDRIDSSKNYCKSNCRWATWKVQGEGTSKVKKEKKNLKTTCV